MKASELKAKILQDTTDAMRQVGTYKNEFNPLVERYADMRVQFEIMMQQWYLHEGRS